MRRWGSFAPTARRRLRLVGEVGVFYAAHFPVQMGAVGCRWLQILSGEQGAWSFLELEIGKRRFDPWETAFRGRLLMSSNGYYYLPKVTGPKTPERTRVGSRRAGGLKAEIGIQRPLRWENDFGVDGCR